MPFRPSPTCAASVSTPKSVTTPWSIRTSFCPVGLSPCSLETTAASHRSSNGTLPGGSDGEPVLTNA